MKATFNLKVNGKDRAVNIDPATPLLYVLRNNLELNGPNSDVAWGSVVPVWCSWKAGQCRAANCR